MGSEGYLLGTAQALIGADLSAGDALSNAPRACMQHRQSMSHSHRQGGWLHVRLAYGCFQLSAASMRLRSWLGSWSYLLGTAR